MTTIIEDSQLNTELQELYLVSKQRLSELTFLDTEYDFLKKRSEEILNPGDDSAEIEKIVIIGNKHQYLKLRIRNYLQLLEPLITHPKQPIDMTLIETYAQIEKELNQFSDEIHAVKSAVLELTKEQHKKTNKIPAKPGKPTLEKN